MAMPFLKLVGKTNFRIGEISFAIILHTPMSSSTRMTPLHSPITPISPIVSVTALEEPSRIAPARFDKLPVNNAKIKEIRLIIEKILHKI